MSESKPLSMGEKMALFAEYIVPGTTFLQYSTGVFLGRFTVTSVPSIGCACDHGLKIFRYGPEDDSSKIVRLYSTRIDVRVEGDSLIVTDTPAPCELVIGGMVVTRLVISKPSSEKQGVRP